MASASVEVLRDSFGCGSVRCSNALNLALCDELPKPTSLRGEAVYAVSVYWFPWHIDGEFDRHHKVVEHVEIAQAARLVTSSAGLPYASLLP